MIVLVLLLVLALLPVLVLHDFSAGGLYCTHTAVSGGVSTWGVTLFVNTTSLNLFSVLAKYSCTSILQIIYARHWLNIFCILTWIVTVCPPLPAAVGESQSLVSSPRSRPESSVHDVRDTPESHIVEETLLSETLLKLWHQEIKRTPLSRTS